MDINDIEKNVNRKRLRENLENLRENFSQEADKIIKEKVSQDTAYWDLKEKLEQVEKNHERLQQNMVEVQMQYESISGQYQEELRLRSETLNKLRSTREICDVLENYCEGLKETLSRCKADQVMLYDAYQMSASVMKDARCKLEQKEKINEQLVESMREKEKLISEHQSEMLKFFTAAKQQADSELADVRIKLSSMHIQKNEQLATVKELNTEVEKYKHESMMKEEMLANLRDEMKLKTEEYNQYACEARNTIAKQESELKEASETCISLKQALCYQEQFTTSICDEKSALQEQIAVLEEENVKLTADAEALKTELKNISTVKANIEQELQSMTDEKNRMQNEIFDYIQQTMNSEKDKQQLQNHIESLIKEKSDVASELNRLKDDLEAKRVAIEKLLEQDNTLKKSYGEIKKSSKSYREDAEAKIKNMQTELQGKDKDIESKTNAINILMTEVKMGTDARSKLEGVVQKLKKEIEQAKNDGKEKERDLRKRIEQLEATIKDRENELTEKLSVILEARNDKERLQKKIQDMQHTIDNINKELIGQPQDTRLQSETDNMAAILSPNPKKMAPQSALTQNRPVLAAPRKQDSMEYNMFSDSSGDAIDTGLVNRRFEALARGENLPPLPFSAFNRRNNVAQNYAPSSLTQAGNVVKSKERMFFKTKRLDSRMKNKK